MTPAAQLLIELLDRGYATCDPWLRSTIPASPDPALMERIRRHREALRQLVELVNRRSYTVDARCETARVPAAVSLRIAEAVEAWERAQMKGAA